MRAICTACLLLLAGARALAEEGSECEARIRTLGNLCLLYAEENEGRLPARLSDLYFQAYTDDLSLFACPASPREINEREQIDERAGYALCAASVGNGLRYVLRDVSQANHGGTGVYVFMSDGSVRWVPAETPQSPDAAPPKPQEVDPETLARAAIERGELHAKHGENDEALGAYAEAIRLDPSLVDAYLKRAELLAYVYTQFERALGDVDRAVRINPQHARAHFYRGVLKLELKQYDDAIRSFDRAIALAPQAPNGYAGRGICYARKGDDTRAIADYSTAISLDPKDVGSHFNRGLRYAALKEYREALEDFDVVLGLNPAHEKVRVERARCRIALGAFDAALRDLRAALERDPGNAMAYYEIGHTEERRGRPQAALSALTQAIKLDPRYAEAYVARAYVLARLGRHQEAARDRERARQLLQR